MNTLQLWVVCFAGWLNRNQQGVIEQLQLDPRDEGIGPVRWLFSMVPGHGVCNHNHRGEQGQRRMNFHASQGGEGCPAGLAEAGHTFVYRISREKACAIANQWSAVKHCSYRHQSLRSAKKSTSAWVGWCPSGIVRCTGQSENSCSLSSERNHRGLGNKIIRPEFAELPSAGEIRCRKRLGGTIRYYHRQAA